MIDYENLNLAHELACKSKEYFFKITFGIEKDCVDISLRNTENEEIGVFSNAGELYKNLQMLMRQRPKYEIEQQLWFLSGNRIDTSIVERIVENPDITYYIINEGKTSMPESKLYPTKQSLIEAQISMWQSLREPKEEFCEISGVKLDIPGRSIICPLCGMAGYENNTTYLGGNPSCEHAFVLNEDEECHHLYLTVGCKVCDSYKMDPNNPSYLTGGCQHERDGKIYANPPNGVMNKCSKCGEFYK